MFRWFLVLNCFIFSLSCIAKKAQIKKKVLNKSNQSADRSLSLIELLNDTGQLKNEIKRDLAKGEEQKKLKRVLTSKKKVVQFGNMKVSISEREEEELKKNKLFKKELKLKKTRLKD